MPLFLVLMYVFFDTSNHVCGMIDGGQVTKSGEVREQWNRCS